MKSVYLIPVPPSANNLFPTGKNGRRFISPEYKAWRELAGFRLKMQRPAKHPGKVTVMYDIGRFPDKRRRDVLNREKALTDLLVDHHVILDDCLIERASIGWADDVEPGQVHVAVEDVP